MGVEDVATLCACAHNMGPYEYHCTCGWACLWLETQAGRRERPGIMLVFSDVLEEDGCATVFSAVFFCAELSAPAHPWIAGWRALCWQQLSVAG